MWSISDAQRFRGASKFPPIPPALTVDYLVVAGGGSGGGRIGGGGGAGGLRCTVTASGGSPGTVESALTLVVSTNYTVTVGAGAAQVSGSSTQGLDGSNSVFSTITSTGGGGGGSYNDPTKVNGRNGGCGGGAAVDGVAGGLGTANQGYAGSGGGTIAGAGGGGAGAIGGASGGAVAGNGGAGVATSITGSSVTYAGGGGGGGYSTDATRGVGGSGGGGNGADGQGNASTNGGTNTGGGGGGGNNTPPFAASAGGSGVVILRYADSFTITIGAGLTGSTSAASGGYKRTTITAGSGNVSWS
jgi:hypothetical protein